MKSAIVAIIIVAFCAVLIAFLANKRFNDIRGEIKNSPMEYKIIDIDGCEYIMYKSYSGYVEVTHCIKAILVM